MLKINTEKELYDFLKILSEESVKKSRKTLKEEPDPYNSYYLNRRKQEKNMFEQDLEAGEDESALDTAPPDDDDQDASEKPDQSAEKETAQQPADSSEEDQFVASKDRLVDFVNDIRSAPSIKDSAVSEQINDYYDRLSQEEKDVLVFFLRELSRVMTGKAAGKNARDPSDPPLSIEFVTKEDSAKKEEEEESTPSAEPDFDPESSSLEKEFDQKPADEDEEDTSAPVPIKVNESQDHASLRAKIKNLLI